MRALLVLLFLVAAAGCGGGTARDDDAAAGDQAAADKRVEAVGAPDAAVPQESPLEGEQEGCDPGSELDPPGERVAWALVATRRVPAFHRPGAKRTLEVFAPETSLGAPTVFAMRKVVVDRRCNAVWYRVQLPMRPNGTTGYVRARGVRPFKVATRIVVDLSDKRLRLSRSGADVLTATIGVGSPETPTPPGTYYVNQKIRVIDRFGPYGPRVLGISAFSPVLTGWAEGGPIAIHGTNDPSSIGKAVSNGCVRVENHILLRLYRATPAGTPVVIRA